MKNRYKNIVASLVVMGLIGCSIVVQLSVGDFPVDVFRFPLNLIILIGWSYVLYELYRNRQRNVLAQYMLSTEATVLSVILLIAGCVIAGLQRNPATTSYPFVVAMFFVLSQLTMVVLRGWRNAQGIRWRFLCNHVGLWLAVGAGFWGAPDTDVMRLMVVADAPNSRAYRTDGSTTMLDYEMTLVDFRADMYDNGTPMAYEADVLVGGEQVSLAVNHPYSRTIAEDIYLVGYEPYAAGVACIVQVVRQPWKWVMAAGIVMLIAGAVMMFVQGPKQRSV